MASVIDMISDASGALGYAADALEAPVRSHMRACNYDLIEARFVVADLLAAATNALADLEGIMPEFEPSGDREHLAWVTIGELRQAIAKAKGEV